MSDPQSDQFLLDLALRKAEEMPGDAMAWQTLGFTYYRATKDLAKARESYERALELDPSLAASWAPLAEILYHLEDYSLERGPGGPPA